MSSAGIAATTAELARLPADVPINKLAQLSTDGLFTGLCAVPGRSTIEKDFEHGVAALHANGNPSPGVALPFLRIPKPAGTSGFDIREQADDPRWIAMQDMCSAMDLAFHDRYTGTIERVAEAVRRWPDLGTQVRGGN